MERTLILNGGIHGGEMVSDIINILPETQPYFTQRKQYFEYFYKGNVIVKLDLEKIQKLNDEGYGVTIYPEEVLIF
jgi:hypothetical protein